MNEYHHRMGMTFIDIEVANVGEPNRGERVEFLVDSGVTYSVVPASVLLRLNIQPLAEQVFRLANGEKIARKRAARSSSMVRELALQT